MRDASSLPRKSDVASLPHDSESLLDLDAEIRRRETELQQLYQRRRERDHAAILLAILRITDSWFVTHELLAAAVLSPDLARWVAGKSPKAVGKLLRTIADAQEQSDTVPALRLLRQERTNGGALWKVETHLPACGLNGHGR